MMWLRMPGQSWLGVAASFTAMWLVMNVAMMLPSLVPMLHRYRDAVGTGGEGRLGELTALVMLGYFTVWATLGMVVFPLGVAVTMAETRLPMLARAVPTIIGVVVLAASLLQFGARKARHLACWRETSACLHPIGADAQNAWRHGVRLGIGCIKCSAGPTMSLLAIGVMDLRAMAVVTAAITLERLLPAEARAAKAVGSVGLVAGAVMIVRAVGFVSSGMP
jgi:predicted metal-binding membrane protein